MREAVVQVAQDCHFLLKVGERESQRVFQEGRLLRTEKEDEANNAVVPDGVRNSSLSFLFLSSFSYFTIVGYLVARRAL